MHKGEIIAVSPKGKGMQKNHTTILMKSDILSSHKDSQDWIIVDGSINLRDIKKGSCDFEGDENLIKSIGAPKKKYNESVKAFSKLDIFQLAEKLNELDGRCKATQVFPLQTTGKPLYDALAYLKT